MRLEAADLYQVRRARLQAERKVLLAQMAQNEARMLLLELEHKYGLLSTDAVLDVESGRVTTPCPELVERHPELVEGRGEPSAGAVLSQSNDILGLSKEGLARREVADEPVADEGGGTPGPA